MIIATNCTGQMCNRLMYFARALALAIDTHRRLIFVCGKCVRDYSDLTEMPANITCLNLPRLRIIDGLNAMVERCLNVVFKHPQAQVKAIKSRSQYLPAVLFSWTFDNDEGQIRNREKIVAYLRPKAAYTSRAREIIAKLPAHELVVGVHMRRGDYKYAWGGKYYYSDAQYLDFFKRFETAVGKKVVFAAVSNERIDEDFFRSNGCNLHDVSGSPYEDVVLLSECEIIMGPPSTFSGWAAYSGGKPLYVMSDIAAPIDLNKLTAYPQIEIKAQARLIPPPLSAAL